MKKNLLKIADSCNLFPFFNHFTRNRAAVFMMHHFCARGERDGISLPADILDKCLQYIVDNGFSVIALSEYVNNLIYHMTLYKTVVFTVDDGYEDFYKFAYPIFKKHRMPVAVFLVSDFVDNKLQLWWDQIRCTVENVKGSEIDISIRNKKFRFLLRNRSEREIALCEIIEHCKTISENERRKVLSQLSLLVSGDCADNYYKKRRPLSWDQINEMRDHNIEFFPHTKTHVILTGCSKETINWEISESKERIESQIGRKADIFCYPNGRYEDVNDEVIDSLKKNGYRAAVCAEGGFDHILKTTDLFRLRRHSFPDDPIKFKQLISGFEVVKDSLRKRL